MESSVRRSRTLFLVQFAILLAIEAIVAFTPLGSLPVGPLVATLAHVPVIIAAISLGTGAGAGLGFAAGLFSFLVWTFMPPNPMLAFAFTPFYSFGEFHGNFWSLVICFVPRVLIGVFAGLAYRGMRRVCKADAVCMGVAAVFGTLANTLLVLGGIYVVFGVEYAAANGVAYELLLGALGVVVATNGVLEIVVAIVAAVAVCTALKKVLKHG